jgi:hypothetical protein
MSAASAKQRTARRGSKPARAAAKAKPRAKSTPAVASSKAPKQATAKPAARAAKAATPKQATAKPAAKAATPKQPKPSPLVRKLEQALALPDEASQCAAIHAQLGRLPRARATAAAAAILAHAATGTPVARAYLSVLAAEGDAPVAGAVVVARYCAAIDRGRKAMRPAFLATWPRAANMAAVDDAYANLAREILEDPALLAAGAEAALRLGNRAVAVERTARLERAKRLAPVVAKLTRDKLAALSADDRRHVYARIIDSPGAFEPELAIAAVAALADDPAVSDMSLASAIAQLSDHGEALVAMWKQRVSDGNLALITRLLALFEWTALHATAPDQLVPFIRALHPAAGRTDVFAQLDDALASDRAVVREAALLGWLGDRDGIAMFDDAQVDKLTRSAVALAEDGSATAMRVLGAIAHPGAAPALIDALAKPRTGERELRGNLYRGLAQLQHPAIAPCLIQRLFVERECYVPLIDALAVKLDTPLHRGVLGALARRDREADAVHAATLYAELLVEQRASRLVVELARTVLARPPHTTDDQRRLRYVFEQAVIAALGLGWLDDARAFLARARTLPDRPYSDFRVRGRDVPTPSPLAGVADQVTALDAGTLDDELARERAEVAGARTAGKPLLADDARLGALVGAAVASRLLDDRTRGVVWFFDELGELHVYDGFAIVPPAFVIAGDRRDGIADMGAFASGKLSADQAPRLAALAARVPVVDERVTFFDSTGERARELIRLGDRILVLDGAAERGRAGIELRAIGIKLPGYVAARDIVARFAANPPPGLQRCDSWSAVRREYAVPVGVARLAVVGSSIEGVIPETLPPIEREHPDQVAAIRALHAWEGRLFAAGGWLAKIWVDVGPGTARSRH